MAQARRISKPIWAPQPGPQAAAAVCPVDMVLLAGSRGGGKSDAAIGRHIRGVEKYGRHWHGLIIRRKYKDFGEIRRRWDSLISAGLPAERIGGDQQTNIIRFTGKYSGAEVKMMAMERLEKADGVQGFQFTEISIDEAPSIPFIAQLIDKLRGCLRSPHGVPCHMFLTGNPGGPGAAAIKAMFKIDQVPPGTVMRDESGFSLVFIRSSLHENRILCENDPNYIRALMSIKDEALRAAWLDGRWDVFVGQALDFDPSKHVVPVQPVPEFAPVYMTFDWGFGKPFSVNWFWVSQLGELFNFAEWYGWNGTPDTGMRLTDSQIAAGIVERERGMGIYGRVSMRLCDPTCFNKKPDYQGGGQGKSTAEVFSEEPYKLHMVPGDPSRKLKIRQLREYMRVQEDTGRPRFFVYKTCEHFIRTIPALCLDESDPEDIDTDQEDHVYDSVALMAMARPLTSLPIPRPANDTARLVDFVTGRSKTPPSEQPIPDNVYAPEMYEPMFPSNRGGVERYADFDS